MHLSRSRHWKWVLSLSAGIAGLAVLYTFSPQEYGFYPRCLFFTLTGMTCPGCGALRALHHLLHGEVSAAFHFNPLVVIFAPLVPFAFATYAFGVISGRALSPERLLRPGWVWAAFAVGIGFAVARNLPFGPLAGFRL